jgi:hypothetical protein
LIESEEERKPKLADGFYHHYRIHWLKGDYCSCQLSSIALFNF